MALWFDHSPKIRTYLVAVLLVAATVLIKFVVLIPLVDHAPIVVPFLLPVILAAWYGGQGPGLLALALAVAVESLLLLPVGWPFGHVLADHLRMWFLIAEGLIVCVLASELHKERQRAWRIAQTLADRQIRNGQERTAAGQRRRAEVHPRDEA